MSSLTKPHPYYTLWSQREFQKRHFHDRHEDALPNFIATRSLLLLEETERANRAKNKVATARLVAAARQDSRSFNSDNLSFGCDGNRSSRDRGDRRGGCGNNDKGGCGYPSGVPPGGVPSSLFVSNPWTT